MKPIPESELIINNDGSIFHLHLFPHQIANDIILVGDQSRVEMITKYFDKIEHKAQNREFVSHTGFYKNKPISVISTGIGTDNIDIVVNELDALVNIDLKTRIVKTEKTSLNFIRIGTSGGLQSFLSAGDFLLSDTAIGFDGLLHYYQNSEKVRRLDFEQALIKHLNYKAELPQPYVVNANKELIDRLGEGYKHGATISASGFYGPQGRVVRLPIVNPKINDMISEFAFGNEKITNYEMESSAIYGLGNMLGHKAVTACLIIANRYNKTALTDYKPKMEELIIRVLDKLAE
ncbi:MAG: nucleoside phosphorylase [Bacteroidales bacterium]|nr:nucleoside phosphorylase [Bacteroidales bacterium]